MALPRPAVVCKGRQHRIGPDNVTCGSKPCCTCGVSNPIVAIAYKGSKHVVVRRCAICRHNRVLDVNRTGLYANTAADTRRNVVRNRAVIHLNIARVAPTNAAGNPAAGRRRAVARDNHIL
jgi:hypothetical protein